MVEIPHRVLKQQPDSSIKSLDFIDVVEIPHRVLKRPLSECVSNFRIDVVEIPHRVLKPIITATFAIPWPIDAVEMPHRVIKLQ